jgi:hypothetical protein
MYKYDRNDTYRPGSRVIKMDFADKSFRLRDGDVVESVRDITGQYPDMATRKFLEIIERKSLVASYRVGTPVVYKHDLPAVHYPEPHKLLKIKPLLLPGFEDGYEGWKPAGEVAISMINDKGVLKVTGFSCTQPSLLDWSARSLYEVGKVGDFTGQLKDGVAHRLNLVGGLSISEGNQITPQLPFFRYSLEQLG